MLGSGAYNSETPPATIIVSLHVGHQRNPSRHVRIPSHLLRILLRQAKGPELFEVTILLPRRERKLHSPQTSGIFPFVISEQPWQVTDRSGSKITHSPKWVNRSAIRYQHL